MLLSIFRYFFSDALEPDSCPLSNTLTNGMAPSLLILSSGKRNQNYYRDMELSRQTRSLFLGENFAWNERGYDLAQVMAEFFPHGRPDAVFLNYNHAYTPRLHGLNELAIPIFAFVGDHYDFTDTTPRARMKQEFFSGLANLAALVSAYPHTNADVAMALGRPDIPFIYLPWAIDPSVFRDLGWRRPYDIACMGALTESKYPFRRMVRAWLEEQRQLRLFGKKRVKGSGGSDHDGEAFNLALNKVYSAFTCASALRYTLMKFFEIPASGALLFGEATPELSALGFRDGEHYVAVSPENYRDRMLHFLAGKGRDEAERIRLAGRDFVQREHTWERRIPVLLAQMRQLLEINRK